MKIGDRPTKKNLRRKIMNSKSYKRGGTPFDLSIHQDVSSKMSELFAGETRARARARAVAVAVAVALARRANPYPNPSPNPNPSPSPHQASWSSR